MVVSTIYMLRGKKEAIAFFFVFYYTCAILNTKTQWYQCFAYEVVRILQHLWYSIDSLLLAFIDNLGVYLRGADVGEPEQLADYIYI